MTARVKVSVAALIAKVEADREQFIADHARAVADYEQAVAKQRPAIDKALQGALNDLAAGKVPTVDTKYSGGKDRPYLVIWLPGGKKLAAPGPKPNTARHDSDLALLRMASEDSLSIAIDDRQWSRYLR